HKGVDSQRCQQQGNSQKIESHHPTTPLQHKIPVYYYNYVIDIMSSELCVCALYLHIVNSFKFT
ncbi:MAG: hypothetical protein IKJ34_06770, partial [Mailhella sp.]|nr:hypothetical protein [Mailhella sp.]